MTSEQKTFEEVNEPVGQIELPSIDVSPYVGKTAKIASAKVCKKIFQGEERFFLRVETEAVASVKTSKGEVPIRGSLLLGLHRDEDGNLGWGAETKAGKFMAKMKAQQPKDLVGKIVQLQKQASNEKFLTFV